MMVGIYRIINIVFLTLLSLKTCYTSGIIINLSKASGNNKISFQEQTTLLRASKFLITVINTPNTVAFTVLQVHSYEFNVTLSYNESLELSYHAQGTNIGLVLQGNGQLFLFNSAPNTNITVMIVAVSYDGNAPIPGGCNMELPTEIAPYMKVAKGEGTVVVEASPASLEAFPKLPCGTLGLSYDMYHYFLPARDFTSETYFKSILKMITLDEANNYGTKSSPRIGPPLQRLYGSYPGTGVVYVAVATSPYGWSVYVPTVTYSCSTVRWEDTCETLTTTLSQVLCGMSLAFGLILCYFGRLCLQVEIFICGSFCGGILGYVISSFFDIGPQGTAFFAFVGAVVLGLSVFKFSMLAMFVPALALGYIVACTIFVIIPDDVSFRQNSLSFWSLFILLCLIWPLFTITCSGIGFWMSAIMGSYAIIIPMDYYLGGHLKYIIINNVRRATVPNFQYAVAEIPFQWLDICLALLFFVFMISGGFFQSRFVGTMSISCCSQRSGLINERTPLLPSIFMMNKDDDDDDVFESPNRNWRSWFH